MKRWESDPVRSFFAFFCAHFFPDELWPRLDEQQSRRCIPSEEIIDKNRQSYLGLPTPKRYPSFCKVRRLIKFMVVSSVSPQG